MKEIRDLYEKYHGDEYFNKKKDVKYYKVVGREKKTEFGKVVRSVTRKPLIQYSNRGKKDTLNKVLEELDIKEDFLKYMGTALYMDAKFMHTTVMWNKFKADTQNWLMWNELKKKMGKSEYYLPDKL